MATEEDNFDIDIYGDGGGDYEVMAKKNLHPKMIRPRRRFCLM